jgi:hypothetical protein
MKLWVLVGVVAVMGGPFAAVAGQDPEQNWTNMVRIGAYGLRADNADAIVRNAEETHVYGIEVDNDIPGRYESFFDPSAKLNAIRQLAEKAHRANNKAFVYVVGTECITANADKSAHSLMKDHPDWVQRKITGEPAVFSSGAAFWISPGDEDVWISPYAKEWRKTYMERIRQIAATGIDGIYVDVPYWMTHFDGWEDSWASFDDATVAAFHEKTGLDAKKDLKLGDFQDANFRNWVDFRIATLTEFMREIRNNAQSVNPNVKVIPEIYPGIEKEATVVGADVYEMYGVADAIAHEYEFGNGEHMAASRTQLDWFLYQVGMLTFRAFAQGKATWILNYSWDGDKGVDRRDAMKNLAMSVVIAGANFWDARGHVMAGSNDEPTRKQIFEWIQKNERTLYGPRKPMHPVGVYFSPKSRDYDENGFLPSYLGTLLALLQAHCEFGVLTPRTLAGFQGQVLVLPNVSALGKAERVSLRSFVERGGRLVVLGTDVTGISPSSSLLAMPSDPARGFFLALQQDFAAASSKPPADLLRAARIPGDIELDAPPTVAANFGLVNRKPHIFLANFGGLTPSKTAIPVPAGGIRVTIPAAMGNNATYLPFLGEALRLQGKKKSTEVQFTLPTLERGAILWIGEAE